MRLQVEFFQAVLSRREYNYPKPLLHILQQMLKDEIRKVYDMPDKPPLYLSTGIRIANIVHARLRQKCSSLNCDLFRCNLIASCNCAGRISQVCWQIVPESNGTWGNKNFDIN
jgi:hypothetical protein